MPPSDRSSLLIVSPAPSYERAPPSLGAMRRPPWVPCEQSLLRLVLRRRLVNTNAVACLKDSCSQLHTSKLGQAS